MNNKQGTFIAPKMEMIAVNFKKVSVYRKVFITVGKYLLNDPPVALEKCVRRAAFSSERTNPSLLRCQHTRAK